VFMITLPRSRFRGSQRPMLVLIDTAGVLASFTA
jgi:hypothetical protein